MVLRQRGQGAEWADLLPRTERALREEGHRSKDQSVGPGPGGLATPTASGPTQVDGVGQERRRP